MAKKKKEPPVERCPCSKHRPINEPWPCCEECRTDHFLWPAPDEILARGGAVVEYWKAADNMVDGPCPKIEIRITADPKKHPDVLLFAWRKKGAKGRWTSLGTSDEASYMSLPKGVDTAAYHWWSQNLAGAVEQLVDLDPFGP